jgi:hypothetical protein
MARTNTYVDPATGNDYKGASFTDGAYTSATKTLVKANAFAANLINHWLKLSSNSGGSIVTGYYKIATRTDASTVILAADAGAGVDATDVKCTQADGTTTLPWHSTQGALDLITRDATNGDQINVKAGGTDTLSAALTLTTYGTPTETAPLVFRGYTSTANDGGIGVISGGGTVALLSGNPVFMTMADMRLTNSNQTGPLAFSLSSTSYGTLVNCQIDTMTGTNTSGTVRGAYCYGCSFSGISGAGSYCSGLSCYDCTFSNFAYRTIVNGDLRNCVVDCSSNVAASAYVRSTYADFAHCIGNTIYGNGNTGPAISMSDDAAISRWECHSNLIVGFSGVGGIGIRATGGGAILGHNAFYNNTTPYALTAETLADLTAHDITLTANPFVSAATGDFRLTAAAIVALRGQRFPETWPNLASMVDLGVIGAWQTAGGGLLINPGLSGGLR